ncbi:MAG: D-glycero-beta-D-manno-heptose 1,7-bisphosphate 7-phosphatase [Candidatus Edwardsbacteria bacterium]|nr:D-glycero-beta-D-manno-heptose 1,7-bisphosphate 7-phosphatase [Candidatus Edwardsbacteria bacterium]
MKKPANIAVFLDRDGTINVERNYVKRPADFELVPDAAGAIRALNKAGLKVIVASNQSGVARGYFTMQTLGQITRKMRLQLKKQGAHLDEAYYCPFHPDDKPYCRKPEIGMAVAAQEKYGLDLKKCYMVGDNKTDMEFGANIGARNVLVLTGHTKGDEPWVKSLKIHCITESLSGAAMWILKDMKQRR